MLEIYGEIRYSFNPAKIEKCGATIEVRIDEEDFDYYGGCRIALRRESWSDGQFVVARKRMSQTSWDKIREVANENLQYIVDAMGEAAIDNIEMERAQPANEKNVYLVYA